ncbi:MAG: exodeoxyribonuclease V subunit gamma [Chlamydiota bacterium]
MPYHLFYSNHIEQLLHHLQKNLSLSVFSNDCVLIPSSNIKDYILLHLAKNIPTVSSIRFLSTEKFLELFYPSCHFPSNWEISIKIEQKITEKLLSTDPLFQPLFNYLKNNPKKIRTLAKTLGPIFSLYSTFGKNLESAWKNPSDWQEALWKEIFLDENWPTPKKILPSQDLELTIHLFAPFSFPKLYHQYLEKLSDKEPFFSYIYTPCQYFWEDVVSETERISLKRFWKKQKVSPEKIEDLDQYLTDRNPLLANFGKVKKELIKLQEKEEDLCIDDFVKSPHTLLGQLQNDILHLCNPTAPQPIEVDSSLQIIEATSKERELEILYQNILSFCQKEPEPLPICVLAPNIEDYVPFIHQIFKNSEMPYKINGISFAKESFFLDGFLLLSSLLQSRWNKQTVCDLLDNPSFQKKQNFSKEEVETLKHWIEKASISWGLDELHRASFVDTKNLFVQSWEYGFQKLVKTLFLVQENTFTISVSEKDLLEKWASLFFQMKKDLLPIEKNPQVSIEEGLLIIKNWVETYLYLGEESSLFHSFLLQGKKAVLRCGAQKISFQTLVQSLENTWIQTSSSYMKSLPYAVHFFSLQAGSLYPSKKIHLLGLHEEFPPHSSLPLLKKECLQDYHPSPNEMYRTLFLDALLFARKEFSISYIGKSMNDGKKKPPSLFVQELLSYIHKRFSLNKPIVTSHPSFSFHKDYFLADSPITSSSEKDFLTATNFYQKVKTSQKHLEKLEPSETTFLSITDLLSLAKNPVRFFCQKGLHIFLENEEEDNKLSLSPLDRYLVQKSSLTQKTKEELLLLFQEKGFFFENTIGKTLQKEIETEISSFSKNLKILQTSSEDLFSVTFQNHCQAPYQKEINEWILPPLVVEMEDKKISIIGKLTNLSSKGILCLQASQLSSWIAHWPSLLISQHLPIKIPPTLLFVKDGKKKEISFPSSTTDLLRNYLHYYQRCSQEVLPLSIASIIKKKEEEIDDRYAHWLFSNYAKPSLEDILSWTPLLAKTFAPLIEKNEVSDENTI